MLALNMYFIASQRFGFLKKSIGIVYLFFLYIYILMNCGIFAYIAFDVIVISHVFCFSFLN